MRASAWTIPLVYLVGLWMLSGCATLLPPSPLVPFFVPDTSDAKLIEALAHEQYTRVESCHQRKSCAQDQYTQGLIALFQSRGRALTSFQHVKTLAPTSRFATWSTSWIEFLQAGASSPSFLDVQNTGAKVTENFVWEVLERELADANDTVRHVFSERAKRVGKMADRPAPAKQDHATISRDTDQRPTKDPEVHTLQKQLQERERLIAERDLRLEVMSRQLDDLKRIELDSKDRRRPVRPSATVSP